MNDAPTSGAVTLRPHRPGDIGWVISRHGALYAAEFGWDIRFEALVARIGADFIDRFDAAREACWIAERPDAGGATPVGSVFLVQARDDPTGAPDEGVAQLRLLLVEPDARGLGLGQRLTEACEDCARRAGYRRIRLWTQSILLAARGIYAAAGYRLVGTEPHRSFGHDLVGEVWELEL
jgi:GNAT superfamily N-acetyltransferase